MSLTWEKVQIGTKAVLRLDAFPVFCGYLLMIALASKWKKISRPLELRPVRLRCIISISEFELSVGCANYMCPWS